MNSSRWGQRGIGPVVVAALIAAGLGLAGCAKDDDENPRSVVQIYSVNNNLPLQSDLYNLGANKEPDAPEDDFIPIDYIPVQFISRPHDPALTMDPDQAFGTVTFTKYTMDFADNDLDDDGTDDVHDLVDYPMNAIVPIGGIGNSAILAVPAGWKVDPNGALVVALMTGEEFVTTAHITFYGEEETSHDAVELSSGIVIGFADYADEN
jgi:hypothetical protein